jgi:hypothetical protein
MGRAFRVRKRSNHVTIVIAQRDGVKSKAKKPAPQKSKKVVEEKKAVTTAS